MAGITERAHLPTGSQCDGGIHSLTLCFGCGIAAASQALASAECCPCAPCACCKKEAPDAQ